MDLQYFTLREKGENHIIHVCTDSHFTLSLALSHSHTHTHPNRSNLQHTLYLPNTHSHSPHIDTLTLPHIQTLTYMHTLSLTQIWSSYDNFIAIGTSGHWVSFLIAAEGLNQDLISSAVIMQKTRSRIS